MKKYGIIALVFGVILITGCGNGNKVVCSGTEKMDQTKIEIKVIGKLKNDKVISVSNERTFADEKDVETYCEGLKRVNDAALSDDAKIDYECKGKKVVIKQSFSEDSAASKNSFIESMENQALACK